MLYDTIYAVSRRGPAGFQLLVEMRAILGGII